jgi:hypothetical protein
MEAYGFSPDESRSAEACGRARNRVYKYRERGRSVGCEALSALVAQGRFDDEEVVDLRRLLGCGLSASLCVAKGQLS